jgi:superfamily II DNA or RNA helicase
MDDQETLDLLGPSSDPPLSEHLRLEIEAVHKLGRSLAPGERVPGCKCERCRPDPPPLYDYQERAIEQLRENMRAGVKNQVLSAPTGSGKTLISAHLLMEALGRGTRSVFVADRISLIDQTSGVLDRYGIGHGVIQASHWRWQPWQRIQVASAQTLARRKWPDDLSLIVVDECHTISQTTVRRIAERDCWTVGLTATPFTRGLGKYYDAVVSVTTTRELIGRGYLAPYRIFAASEPDMRGAKVVAGEWTEKESAERSMPIVGDCVREYLDKASDKKFIAFGVNVAHCEEIQRQFLAAGVPTGLYTYQTGTPERAEMITEFRKPDSYLRGLISVSALAKGFDVEDVGCIIMARPLRKSLAEHVQIFGRGLRKDPADPAKECIVLDHSGNCIAAGQRVLTDRGLVPIELILKSDRLWDGVEFVSHGGAIYRGRKRVIEYAGLTATPDHRVRTANAWRAFGECAKEQAAIRTTGVGGTALRERDDYFTRGSVAREAEQPEHARPLRVRYLREPHRRVSQQFGAWQDQGLQAVQRPCDDDEEAGNSPAMVVSAGQGDAAPLHEPEIRRIRALRRQGHRVPIHQSRRMWGVDCPEPWASEGLPDDGVGSCGQRRALRAREHPLGITAPKREQHPHVEVGTADAQIQTRASGNPICGFHPSAIPVARLHVRADRGEVPPAVKETEREVWDILDAGPRNRFTCEGLLVHNCLRFWEPMNVFFDEGAHELDDGKRKPKKKAERTKPEPQKCPRCAHVHPPRPACPLCGHEYPRRSIRHIAGELTELGQGPAVAREERAAVYAALLWIATDRGRKEGWAAHTYRERYGIWPRHEVEPAPPSPAIANWVKSRDIAWAKGKKKRERTDFRERWARQDGP